jgi:hypothetical protein
MLVAVVEEIWPWPERHDSKPHIIGPVDAADGYDAARELARLRASKFESHDYEGEQDYWWGHNKDEPVLHRYVVRAS